MVRSLKEKIVGMKPRVTMNNDMRQGYRLLLKVINMVGVRARKACGVGRLQNDSDASARRRRKDALAEELVNSIKQFFLRDDISCQLPEKKFSMGQKGGERIARHIMRYAVEKAHQIEVPPRV